MTQPRPQMGGAPERGSFLYARKPRVEAKLPPLPPREEQERLIAEWTERNAVTKATPVYVEGVTDLIVEDAERKEIACVIA